MSLKERLEELRQQGLEEIKQSDDLDRVNDVRVKLLGMKWPWGTKWNKRCTTLKS